MTRTCAALRVVLGIGGVLACAEVRAEPGDGLRLGEFDVRPSVALEAGYQTNVHLVDRPDRTNSPDDWLLRIVPQITVERSGGRAKIAFHALYDWRKYAYNTELDARDNVEIGASTAVNEDRILGFTLEDRFRVQSRPMELEVLGNYRRIHNAARLGTQYRPGTALEVRPSVYWLYDRFSSTERNRVFAERQTTGVIVDTRYAFLSRTVLVLSGEGGEVRYTESIALPPPQDEVNSGSVFWRVDAGVVGQMRPKLNIALKGGYGQAYYRDNEDLDDLRGITATIKGEWTPRPTNQLVAGYERTFSDVFFTNFDVVDRLFARYRHLLAGVWLVSGATTAEWQEYSRPFARRDFVLRVEPGVRRVIRKWADVGAAYAYEQRWSNESGFLTVPSADAPSDYVTHRFMATANFQF